MEPPYPGVVALEQPDYAQDLQISSADSAPDSSFGVARPAMYVDGVPADHAGRQGQVSKFPLTRPSASGAAREPFFSALWQLSGGVIALTTALKTAADRGE